MKHATRAVIDVSFRWGEWQRAPRSGAEHHDIQEGGKHGNARRSDGAPRRWRRARPRRTAGFAGVAGPQGPKARSAPRAMWVPRTGRSNWPRRRRRRQGRSRIARSRRRRRREGRVGAAGPGGTRTCRTRRPAGERGPAGPQGVAGAKGESGPQGRRSAGSGWLDTRTRWRSRRTRDAARRVVGFCGGNCSAGEIMVSAPCVGAAVVATASDNGATCGENAKARRVARRSSRQERSDRPRGARSRFSGFALTFAGRRHVSVDPSLPETCRCSKLPSKRCSMCSTSNSSR